MRIVTSTKPKGTSRAIMRGKKSGPDRSMSGELGSSYCTASISFVKQQAGSTTQHASTGTPLNVRGAQSKTTLSTTLLNGRCGIIQSSDSKLRPVPNLWPLTLLSTGQVKHI